MGCAFSGDKWKREQVPDHKFEYVNIEEYKKPGIFPKIAYSSVFLLTFKSVLVTMADVSTAVLLLKFNQWSVASPEKIANDPTIRAIFPINADIYKTLIESLRFIYVGSIFVSFLLLAVEGRKARRIVKSRDISFAFTDVIAYRYYCLRSFGHWCFFNQIRSQQKFRDQLTQFIFFRLKGWTSLLFAETPRHAINLMIMFFQLSVLGRPTDAELSAAKASGGSISTTFNMDRAMAQIRAQEAQANFALMTMAFVLGMYMINATTTILAALMYIPLLCRIRGNLKEYVCHMIDKRIGQLMQRKVLQRIQAQEKEFARNGYAQEDPTRPRAELPSFATLDAVPASPGSYVRIPNQSNYSRSYNPSIISMPTSDYTSSNRGAFATGNYHGINSPSIMQNHSNSSIYSNTPPSARRPQQYYNR